MLMLMLMLVDGEMHRLEDTEILLRLFDFPVCIAGICDPVSDYHSSVRQTRLRSDAEGSMRDQRWLASACHGLFFLVVTCGLI